VKQKYLGKEVRCPSCQQLVSMKPGMMLTSNGSPLSVAKPELVNKQAKPKAPPPKRPPEPTIRVNRIPPPPQVGAPKDTDDQQPMKPQLIEDDTFVVDEPSAARRAATVSPMTVHDGDSEFEVVDTQFNMELKESGIDSVKAKPPMKKNARQATSPPPVQTPPPKPNVPSGLHKLSGSEMMKVNLAALQPVSMAQFHCINGHLLEVDVKYRGMQVQCPMCKVIFPMPTA
jgi:phage FluMu protein Com